MDKLLRGVWHGQPEYMGGGRQLLALSDSTWTIAVIVAGALVGALILGVVGFLVWTKCGRAKSSPIHPVNDKDPEKGPGVQAWPAQQVGMQPMMMAIPGLQPMPPWEQYGQPPPGIMLSPSIPTGFVPFTSNPRPASAPPYERLVLVSSRVHQPMKVAEAALPNVAVVVYDWKLFTLQELLSHIKRTIGPGSKVTSIAVVAPGNKPGGVALLEGQTTDKDKLAAGTGELAQFWRVLAGCVAANGVADGRRVDLLGCRVLESPQEGAALLKALWTLTSVPFAAADDALLGYQLATFLEEPHSGALSVIASTIQAIDLYFNRHTLLGIEPPSASQGAAPPGLLPPLPSSMYAPPMPAGAPPPAALQQLPQAAAGAAMPAAAPLQASMQAPMQAAPMQATAPAAVVAAPKDIFARFAAAVAASGSTAAATFTKYDKDKSGFLGQDEVIYMVTEVVPGTSALDAEHFRAMLDLDGNQLVSQAEFVAALTDNSKASATARAGRDENSLMTTLHDYLTDNDAVIRQCFNTADADESGALNHSEVVSLVAQIPGLELSEQKLIASYLYQHDTSGTGLLTFDQLKSAIRAYGTASATAAVQTPFPNQASAAAPATQGTATAALPYAPVAAGAPVAGTSQAAYLQPAKQGTPVAIPNVPVPAGPPLLGAPQQAGYSPLTPAAGSMPSTSLQQPSAAVAGVLPTAQPAGGLAMAPQLQAVQAAGQPALAQPAAALTAGQPAPAVLQQPAAAASQPSAAALTTPLPASSQQAGGQPKPMGLATNQLQPVPAAALPPAYQVLTPVPITSSPAGAVLAQPGQLLSPAAAPAALPTAQQPTQALTSLAAAPSLLPAAGVMAAPPAALPTTQQPTQALTSLAAAPTLLPAAGLPSQGAAFAGQNIAPAQPSTTVQGAAAVQGVQAGQAGQPKPAGQLQPAAASAAAPVTTGLQGTAWQQAPSPAPPAVAQPAAAAPPVTAVQAAPAGQPTAALPLGVTAQPAQVLQPAAVPQTGAASVPTGAGWTSGMPSGVSVPAAAGRRV